MRTVEPAQGTLINLGDRLTGGWAGLARRAVLDRLAGLAGADLRLVEGDREHRLGDGRGPLIRVTVRDARMWPALAAGGTTAAGEAYVEGWWDCDDLTALVEVLAADMDRVAAMDTGWRGLGGRLLRRLAHALRPNTRAGARANIAAHYDLSNEFYRLFLDESMMYSAAIYPHADADLETAQRHRLDTICRDLRLGADDHLVEIGTGWGGMAIHAARTTGCRVTTTTISRQQAVLARERIAAAGLAGRITVLEADYRDLPGLLGAGSATRLVSLEMVEAIGQAQYRTYARTITRLLRADGLALVQTITVPDRRFAAAAREVDFIKRHIFPGCCIPSVATLLDATRAASDLDLVGLRDLTADYARTLAHWRQRFVANAAAVASLGFDARFRRLWLFYLAYCEGGFRARAIGDVHLLLARPRASLA